MLSEQVLTRWWRLVAFMKAMDLLHQAMRTVLYCRIATAVEMASKGGGHFAHLCVDCVPGGRRGDTEQVVAQRQSLVAFTKALARIAPAHRHGHRNCPRWRCICSPPPPISIAVIVAKDHVMFHLN